MSERPLYTPPFTQDARWLVQSPLYKPDQCATYYQSTIDAFCQLRHKAQKGLLNDLEAPFIQQKKSPTERRHTLKTIVVFGTAKDIGFIQPMTSVIQSWAPVESAWPRVLFYDTIDPRLFWEMMSCTQLDTAHFFFISSTGHAPEAVLPLMRCIDYWHKHPQDVANAFTIIAPKQHSVLSAIANQWTIRQLEYPPSDRGFGHYFSQTLLSIPEMAGFQSDQFNKGARETCMGFFRRKLHVPMEYVALFLMGKKKAPHITSSYETILFDFTQLTQWMNCAPHNPEPWMIPVDPLDAKSSVSFYTLFMKKNMTQEQLNPDLWRHNPILLEWAQHPFLASVYKNHDTLCRAMLHKGHFVRTLYVQKMDEYALGALLMNHILETLLIKEIDGTLG